MRLQVNTRRADGEDINVYYYFNDEVQCSIHRTRLLTCNIMQTAHN